MNTKDPDSNEGSDVFNIQNAGAVGRYAKAEHIFFQSGSDTRLEPSNITKLVTQLSLLQAEIERKTLADSEATKKTVESISLAREAAQSGDRSGVLRHLKNTGHWVLEVAEKIGIEFTIQMLKKAIDS